MIERRPYATLGSADHGWLSAKHHFSFGDHADPARLHWGALRVLNDDTVAPNSGFPLHPHANMEIVTYVREGAITHEDSLGNRGRTKAGDVQVMSAGSGIRHAEYSLEPTPSRLFQIWILPNRQGHAPCWGTKPFPKDATNGRFAVLASGFEADTDALPIHADARVAGATLQSGETVTYPLGATRHAYLVAATGRIEVNGIMVDTLDGAAVRGEDVLTVKALSNAEVILIDAV
jgi:hypothetical protein